MYFTCFNNFGDIIMHNNISIPILKPNFKQTVSEKHIIQDTPASDTPKNNKKIIEQHILSQALQLHHLLSAD